MISSPIMNVEDQLEQLGVQVEDNNIGNRIAGLKNIQNAIQCWKNSFKENIVWYHCGTEYADW